MTTTVQQNKSRKRLLIYPLLFLPFATLAFWALDGGKGAAQTAPQQQGLNHQLPQAHLSEDPLDKMSLYRKAAADSAALRERKAMDPFNMGTADGLSFTIDSIPASDSMLPAAEGLSRSTWRYGPDANELKVTERLKKLEDIMTMPPQPPVPASPQAYQPTADHANLDRLEQMMQSMTTSAGGDPEMKQLGQMLESIKDIQNPARVQQRLREQSEKNRGRVYTVDRPVRQTTAGYLSNGASAVLGRKVDSKDGIPVYEPLSERNGFYDLEDAMAYRETGQTAIPAVIHETQTVVSGSTVKMRLTEEVMVNGVLIPQGTFIYGSCAISGERLTIDIPGLRYGKRLFPVSLAAFSLDGLEGISIPGALTRDAAKEGMDRTVQSLNLMSMDPSIAAQAAGAGVEVAKGLFGKKVKMIRVTLKAGFPLLLMDAKAKQDLE
ncbi:conjugative transposon protein TraM [Chitinophaga oryzae]|uniref:Conjugative transposon protein TraM n=1 Tax=Chitinophaga oryzae TaxID=2725414 RepID=A0AAE6ZLI8_9BACT|nr:conjugative transposon protein TraM [Chitinophaga oryzae]QJB34919.1 conjugative transposon protein TraM [Chitinophaga oryzae]QJB41430.1 conjugative transposon protein TraM [Chitinophaga oryzae]